MAVVTRGASKAKRVVGRKSLKKEKIAANKRSRRKTKHKIQKKQYDDIPTVDEPEVTGWDVS